MDVPLDSHWKLQFSNREKGPKSEENDACYHWEGWLHCSVKQNHAQQIAEVCCWRPCCTSATRRVLVHIIRHFWTTNDISDQFASKFSGLMPKPLPGSGCLESSMMIVVTV